MVPGESRDATPPPLAPAYQLALDLEAEGVEGDALAERLGVPVEALDALLAVAHAKAGAPAGPGENA